jgi:hypothetical protein
VSSRQRQSRQFLTPFGAPVLPDVAGRSRASWGVTFTCRGQVKFLDPPPAGMTEIAGTDLAAGHADQCCHEPGAGTATPGAPMTDRRFAAFEFPGERRA